MKDSERLDLLKEIGGTRVYEERRRESLKIMQETGKEGIVELGFLLWMFSSMCIILCSLSSREQKKADNSSCSVLG
jgi:hypothetical protein